jgi:hypothetical protein
MDPRAPSLAAGHSVADSGHRAISNGRIQPEPEDSAPGVITATRLHRFPPPHQPLSERSLLIQQLRGHGGADDGSARRTLSPRTPSQANARAQAQDTEQDVINRQVALGFSPLRPFPVLPAAPGVQNRHVLDETLVLMPEYSKPVVDRINRDCMYANLGGGGNRLWRYPRVIQNSCVAVGDRYTGLAEAYSFSRTTPDYGRLYCPTGSQSLSGKVRRHVFYRIYEDLDIVNAQPNMVRQLMRITGYEGPMEAIAEYCDHRDTCLTLVVRHCTQRITRDDAKSLFVTILFGSTLNAWEATHGFIEDDLRARLLVPYEREVRAFSNHFMRVYGDEVKSHDLKTDEQIISERKSVVHRRLALFFQNEERKVMSLVATFLGQTPGASIGVLVHDGMLVHVPGGAETIIPALEAYVEAHSQYRLKFVVKSLAPTETLDELVAGILTSDDMLFTVPVYDPKAKDDMLFLDAFMTVYQDNLVFDADGKMWHYGDSVYPVNGRGRWHEGGPPTVWWMNAFPGTPFAKEARKILTFQTLLNKAYPQLGADILWEQYDDHWFPTRDCLVNLMNDETRAYSPELMVSRKCNLPYVKDVLRHPDYAAEVHALHADNARLYNGDEELMSAVEERLAYCLFVRGNPLKKIFNLVGLGNNGKSTLLQRVKALTGRQFATSLDAAHLTKRSEPTAPNPALTEALSCNLVAVEEPCTLKPFSCALLKEYSGNTEVKARKLYANMGVEQPNNMTLVICSNAPFATAQTDQALINRVERVEMPCKFYRSAEVRDEALALIECAIERSAAAATSHVGDTSFAKRYETEKMRQVYFASLKFHYANYVRRGGELKKVPDAYSYADCEEVELEAMSVDTYDLLVEETGELTDYMSTSDLTKLLKAKNAISVGRDMKLRIAKSTKVARARSRGTNGFTGIRPRT